MRQRGDVQAGGVFSGEENPGCVAESQQRAQGIQDGAQGHAEDRAGLKQQDASSAEGKVQDTVGEMRWTQRVRTVRILRMGKCKRGCVFLQSLQGPGFP